MRVRRIAGSTLVVVALAGAVADGQELDVSGVIESTSGGFVFPDDSVQTTAGDAYAQVVVVAKSGGHFASIQTALDSILDAASAKRYLVWVAPGEYSEAVTMKAFVDLAGAGRAVTTITSAIDGLTSGTVRCADDSELRDLTVINSGGGTDAVAIYCAAGAPAISRVTASAMAGSGRNNGVRNDGAASVLTDVEASASGGTDAVGVENLSAAAELWRVEATAADGSTTTCGVFNSASPAELIDVVATASGSGALNVGVSNAGATGVTLLRVHAEATGTGSSINAGVDNEDASISIVDSVARASGGSESYGVRNGQVSGAYSVEIHQSELAGADATLSNDTGFTSGIALTLLDGGDVDDTNGTVTCIGVVEVDSTPDAYDFSAASCP